MLLSILIITILLLLVTVLVWAFVSFFKLVTIEHQEFPNEWEKDGQPFGIYLNGFRTHSYFRSGLAGQWRMWVWLFRTPKWVRMSEQASTLLWQYRALVLIWNLGLILWLLAVGIAVKELGG